MDKLIFNKEKFMATDFGKALEACVCAWNRALTEYSNLDYKPFERQDFEVMARCRAAQWRVYQLAMQEFYGVKLHFTRTEDYFGVCTEDDEFWLFKIDRI